MDFKIHSESESKSARPHAPPPNYSSTAWRLRLASLVAAFGLVLVAMQEAGKPETWEWMEFASSSQQISSTDAPVSTNLPSNDDGDGENLNAATDPLLKNFWNAYFNSLKKEQKKSLVQILWQNSHQINNDQIVLPDSKKFVESYISRNSDLSDDGIEQIRNSQNSWEEFFKNKPPTQSQTIQEVRTIFEDSLYAFVEDRSAMNRSAESAAWYLSWKKIGDQAPHQDVTFVQLSGQPNSYRGEKIRVAGNARLLQKIDLPADHELGFDSYKVLWIKPADSSHVPYCVYVSELPDGFPQPTAGDVELHEDITVDGVFFKLRSYAAQNGQIEICPLIVAESIFFWQATPQSIASTPQPPYWFLTLFFIGMPIIAAWMAWRVYKSTSTSTVSKIGAGRDHSVTWDQLANRNDIKSDIENVNELYSSD